MVHRTSSAFEFKLIDVLHLKLTENYDQKAFMSTIIWFIHFMIAEAAPKDLINGFVERLHLLGIEQDESKNMLLQAYNLKSKANKIAING